VPSRYRVPVGWLVGLVVVALARPTPGWLLVGLPLACAGEALRLWASGHIEKTKRLATGGPYAHSRNPLYVGSLLIALGVAAACASPWVVLAVAAYFLAFYPTVMREEAAFLAQKFAGDYATWAAAVPLFWPRVGPAGPRTSRFDWARVRTNKEWRTALALPLLAAVLFALPHVRHALGLY
jgi:protein-S-isoprenylcysteine O-methyltransferase Ste14